MSYQDKLDAALALVREHNSQFVPPTPQPTELPSPLPEGFIDETKFVQCIKFKARNEDALRGLKYEQILECLPSAFGTKPDSLAKDIAKVFRGTEEAPEAVEGVQISDKKAGRMTWRELVANFDPGDVTSAATKRLEEVAKGRAFISFSSGRIVDVDSTLKLFMEIKNNYPPRKIYNGKPVYAIGNVPGNFADENPIYHGRPLRPDGSCDQTNRSWDGVSTKVRQLVCLAVQMGLIKVNVENGIHVAHNLIDLAVAADAEKRMTERFAEATVEWDRLNSIGKLPSLKVELSGKQEASQGSPFKGGRRVGFTTTTLHGKTVIVLE